MQTIAALIVFGIFGFMVWVFMRAMGATNSADGVIHCEQADGSALCGATGHGLWMNVAGATTCPACVELIRARAHANMVSEGLITNS
jgi:hypothetical protein